MKPRCAQSAGELAETFDQLGRRLERVCLPTQPEIAVRVLELTSDPEAQVQDYAKVIRNDAALTGRLLKLANSAFFAQRQRVTTIERACVLVGLERLKAVSLGFYLAKGAAGQGDASSRKLWGQSVFRACFASEMAKLVLPGLTSESFVVGLMLDCGVGLMPKLMGAEYTTIAGEDLAPVPLFRREFATLAFTHADVADVLLTKWRLPDVLVKPIARHHAPPAETLGADAVARMHALAYYVGAIDLRAGAVELARTAPLPSIASRVFGLDADQIKEATTRAAAEYDAAQQLFAGMASTVDNLDGLCETVSVQLAMAVDRALSLGGAAPAPSPAQFRFGGHRIEVLADPSAPGCALVYVYDGDGNRLINHRFAVLDATADQLYTDLCLEPATDDQREQLFSYLSLMAA